VITGDELAKPVGSRDRGATAFENVDAFRTGFFQGEQACVQLVPA
jgi:hypothetical protein